VELLDATLLGFVAEAGHPVPPGLACLLLVDFERETAAAARGVVGDAVRGLRALAAHVETAPDRSGLEALWRVRTLASPALAALPATRRSLQVIEDGCVPLPALGAYVAGVRAAAARREIPVAIFGHAGDGHVHVNALPDVTAAGWEDRVAGLFADVSDQLVALGGTAAGEHGDGRLRAPLVPRVYGAEVTRLFRRLKDAYDPRGVFNPGVVLSAAAGAPGPLAHLKVGAAAAAIPADIAARLREVERTGGWLTPKTELAR
jgi:FAD/FMN-containing dehydrogenase